MTIAWYEVPTDCSAKPFDGELQLIAVPHRMIAVPHRINGTSRLDPDHPFSIYLAFYDASHDEWITSEEDDERGGSFRIKRSAASFWAEITYPPTIGYDPD